MEVKLITYTQEPELTCAKAMKSCRTKESAFELNKINKIHFINLARRIGHLSVLEHANFTFSVKGVSRSCTHQLVRHRIASYSQQSLRAIKPDGIVLPPSIEKDDIFTIKFFEACSNLWKLYDMMISHGIPKQDARYILPMGTRTNIVITMNARELRHFFNLRLSKDAQWEIRDMARLMLEEVKRVAPTIFGDIK